MPLVKDNGAVRSVGFEPSLVRPLHKEVDRVNKPVLASYLETQQLAISVGGAAKLVNSVRMLLETNPDFVSEVEHKKYL